MLRSLGFMEEFSTEELGHFVRTLSASFDEIEVLSLFEERLHVSSSSEDRGPLREVRTHSLMFTGIRKQRLHRFSICADDRDKLKGRIIAPSIDESEISSFSLNSPERDLMQIGANFDGGEYRSSSELLRRSEEYQRKLGQKWPNLDVILHFEQDHSKTALVNSHGVKGRYEKTFMRTIVLFKDRTLNTHSNIWNYVPVDFEDLADSIENRLVRMGKPASFLQNLQGSLPVLLSPRVVETICCIIAGAARLGLKWDTSMFSVLPDAFQLIDEPYLNGGYRSAPFDDEGTPTSRKTICYGPDRVTPFSDLATAHEHLTKSTGNGFRRGPFFEPSSDRPPSCHPSNLMLRPGEARSSDILTDHDQVLLLTQIPIPFSQLSGAGNMPSTVSLIGEIYQHGKHAAYWSGKRRVSSQSTTSRPGSFLGLIDRSAIVLKDGNLMAAGWFPHIFVPEMRW